MIMDFEMSFSPFFQAMGDLKVLTASDDNGVNSGTFITKSSQQAKDLMDLLAAQSFLVSQSPEDRDQEEEEEEGGGGEKEGLVASSSVLNSISYLNPSSSFSNKFPFEYEQRSFHYLLNTPLWRQRGNLPTYSDYLNIQAFDLFFSFLLHCAFFIS